MIIFFASGQLGNQIFQVLFSQKVREENRRIEEKILLVGFDDFKNTFETDFLKNTTFIKRKSTFHRLFWNRLMRNFLLKFLAKIRLISFVFVEREIVFENYSRETTKYIYRKGLLNNVLWIKTSFAQSESFFFEKDAKQLKIKSIHLGKAKKILAPFFDKKLVFIHIRLGDMRNFKVFGKNVIPPFSYYQNQIDYFISKYKDIHFVLLSDEPQNVINNLKFNSNQVFVSQNNSFYVDFTIMTLCNGAILSPSSFGWWGSYFMQYKIEIFAPKHWLGFESGINNPIFPNFTNVSVINIIAINKKIVPLQKK